MAALCISAIVGVMGYRAWQMFSTRLWVFLPIRIFKIIDPEMQKTIDFLARHSYVNFLSRLAALGTGVLTAMAVSDKGFRQWVGRCAWLLMTKNLNCLTENKYIQMYTLTH